MKNYLLLSTTLLLLTWSGRSTSAAETAVTTQPATTAETVEEDGRAVEQIREEVVPVVRENTLEACSDGVDNDDDTFVDCADQDCAIYVRCLPPPPPAAVPAPPSVEQGALCRDGNDNDGDGTADCHDSGCVDTRYCRSIMYERPENPKKAPGMFFSAGFGAALPNFNWKDIRVDSRYGNNIPFDPDLGVVSNFRMGFAPLPWLGFGLNLSGGTTFATNRAEFMSVVDTPDRYKYDGYKVFGHLGGFVRLQVPLRRVIPYVDILGGYGFARYKWRVYDADTHWSDIDNDWDEPQDDGPDYHTRFARGDHFTLALEPGFTAFVIPRTLGIGAGIYIPVWSSSDRGMDNLGILVHATFTPTWREPKQLKAQYRHPAP